MKRFVFLLIITQINYSQTIQVFDFTTKDKIPFATVFIDTKGFYTDENGKFTINTTSYDSIIISHLNYSKIKFYKQDISDSIFLKPKVESLNVVDLYDYSKYKKRNLKAPRKFFSLLMKNQSEIISCFCLKKEKYLGSYISKLRFRLSNSKYHIDVNDIGNQEVTLRLNVYENINQHAKEPIFSYEPETFLLKNVVDNNFFFDFDIDYKPILLSEKGFCLGLEHIEFSNKNSDNLNKELFFDSYINKSRFFETNTYLYYPLRNNDTIISNKNFHDIFFKEMNINKDTPVFIPEMKIYHK